MAKVSKKKVLVVCLTYKNPGLLEKSLRSLCESKDSEIFDVVVVDNNNGQDVTAAVVPRLQSEFDCIKEYIKNENNSIPVGFNLGVEPRLFDGYQYVSFWCDDWCYSTGAFPEMIKCLEKDKEYGCATAVSNYCSTSEDFIPDGTRAYLRSLDSRISIKFLINVVNKFGDRLLKAYSGKVEDSPFFCIGFLCKQELLEDVGLFNPMVESMNDVELSLRAFKKGWKSIVCRGAYIHHIGMHAGWSHRPVQEHRNAEQADRKLFATSEDYKPNELLISNKFWLTKLKEFYE